MKKDTKIIAAVTIIGGGLVVLGNMKSAPEVGSPTYFKKIVTVIKCKIKEIDYRIKGYRCKIKADKCKNKINRYYN